MKQLLLICAVVVMVGCWKKEAPKEENRVRVQRSTPYQELPKATVEKLIADPLVEKWIRGAAKKPTGELTQADFEKLTHLFLDNHQLTNVKGLENLTELRDLSIDGNQLTEVPKGLEKLTELQKLSLLGPTDTRSTTADFRRAILLTRFSGNEERHRLRQCIFFGVDRRKCH